MNGFRNGMIAPRKIGLAHKGPATATGGMASALGRRAFARNIPTQSRRHGTRHPCYPISSGSGRVVADEVLGAAGEVGELRGGDVDSQPLVERGEDVAEMNWSGFRLLAPARGRAEDSAVPHAAAGQEGTVPARRNSANGRATKCPRGGTRCRFRPAPSAGAEWL